MISVIIPAYNEAAVIERCLRAITDGAPAGALEVIVACNGCRDETAEIARRFGGPVRVVETPTASKVAALNLGDESAQGFPRFYVDADVVLPWSSIEAVSRAMEASGKPAGSPRLRMALDGCGLGVKAYYAVWTRLTFHRHGMIGVGVYALTEAGRARFGAFPQLIADDGYVRSLFGNDERAVPAEGGEVTVHGPRALGGLVKIKTRSRLGLAQLRRYDAAQAARGMEKDRFYFAPVLVRPWLWPAALVYLYVNLLSRSRAGKQLQAIEDYQWERDESSRESDGRLVA